MKRLEHEADWRAARGGAAVLVEGGQLPASQQHLPARRRVEAGEDASSVDLPAPEAPTIARRLPGARPRG